MVAVVAVTLASSVLFRRHLGLASGAIITRGWRRSRRIGRGASRSEPSPLPLRTPCWPLACGFTRVLRPRSATSTHASRRNTATPLGTPGSPSRPTSRIWDRRQGVCDNPHARRLAMRGTLPRMTTRQWMRVVLLVALSRSVGIRLGSEFGTAKSVLNTTNSWPPSAQRRRASIPTPASPDGSNTTRRWPASTEMSPTFSGSPSRRS